MNEEQKARKQTLLDGVFAAVPYWPDFLFRHLHDTHFKERAARFP